jgi:tRNA-(ms[2]io[6]A)-hydroxylase
MDLVPSPDAWLDAVLADFDSFLKDHASCEKKASGMALAIASHYPDRPAIVAAMADLAVEELTHYREVLKIMLDRGVTPGPDVRDPYVRALHGLIRQGPDHYLLDRLLIAAVVERRGSERFGRIAAALEGTREADLAAFYRAITASEARHWQLFIELAQTVTDGATIESRLAELVDAEGQLMQSQPPRPALH